MRKKSTIQRAIRLLKKNPNRQIVSIFYTKKNFLKKKLINGVIYLTPVKQLKKYKTFYHNSFLPLLMKSKKESIDIDTMKDLMRARNYYNKNLLD